MIEFVQQVFGIVFGLVIAGGLMAFIYKRDAVDWEKLEKAYGQPWTPPMAKKRFQSMMLYSDGRLAKSYKGLLTIGLYANGIGIRPFIWLMPFQSPIFVPYSDIQGWKQKWYIDAASTELAFRKAPQMRIIMPADQVEWMSTLANGRISISEDRPPHGSWPWATFILAIAMGLMAIGLIGVLIFNYMNQ